MSKGIPDGWELVRIGQVIDGEHYLGMNGKILLCEGVFIGKSYVVIRKIEKPKQYRPFANATEYFANRREGFAVDWKIKNDTAPGFFAVVSANEIYCWVAFGTEIERFDWDRAFEKLQFRNVDNSTSPFGIEVTE